MGIYHGSRTSIDSLMGKYLGYGMCVLFVLTYHVPVHAAAVLAFITHTQQRGDCINLGRSLLPTGRNDHYFMFQRSCNK